VDAVYKRALECGAVSVREPSDQPYGDRSGGVQSVNGVQWWIGTHIEDVSEEELQQRMAAQSAAH
jgi:PhnB protein